MVPITRRFLWNNKTRFFLTVAGVSFTVMLILFLCGIYEGVKQGATGYVRSCAADIWICQKNSTNLLRSSSFMQSSVMHEIEKMKGYKLTTGILRVLATTEIHGQSVTMFIFGFDPSSHLGAPVNIVQGTSAIGPGEIILDRAFAAKNRLTIDDSLRIQSREFRVAGISDGTNAIVAQFAFTTLQDAQQLIGLPGIISFCLSTIDKVADDQQIVSSIKQKFPSLAAFSKAEFIQNNIEEMENGVLPILWTIALFGGITGIAVITLMLYSAVLENREDFALLRAIGANRRFLIWLVIKQSLAAAFIGYLVGLTFNFICAPLIMKLVPEITLHFTWRAVGASLCMSLFIGVVASWAPLHKLASIYPGEVFRP